MDGLDASLQELIDFAQPLVPASQRKQTPIYLYATAGMRVLGYDSQVPLADMPTPGCSLLCLQIAAAVNLVHRSYSSARKHEAEAVPWDIRILGQSV